MVMQIKLLVVVAKFKCSQSTYESCFSFQLKISDILKRDVISKKGYFVGSRA